MRYPRTHLDSVAAKKKQIRGDCLAASLLFFSGLNLLKTLVSQLIHFRKPIHTSTSCQQLLNSAKPITTLSGIRCPIRNTLTIALLVETLSVPTYEHVVKWHLWILQLISIFTIAPTSFCEPFHHCFATHSPRFPPGFSVRSHCSLRITSFQHGRPPTRDTQEYQEQHNRVMSSLQCDDLSRDCDAKLVFSATACCAHPMLMRNVVNFTAGICFNIVWKAPKSCFIAVIVWQPSTGRNRRNCSPEGL